MGGGGGGSMRELDRTPTWAVALVVAIIIIISIVLEKFLHLVGAAFKRRKKAALVEALEKIKAELMVLGFISLLLTFGQNYIAKICIPERIGNTLLPCELDAYGETKDIHRRLLWQRGRILAADSSAKECLKGYVPLISVNGLHQLHIFIFFLAIFHVLYSALTMKLGRMKTRRWKDWEREIELDIESSNDPSRFRLTKETSFVKGHTTSWMDTPAIFYFVCLFRHTLYSVRKSDYLTLRHGFIAVHLAPGTGFDFHKYIKRSLEDDYKVVVGIPPFLWMTAVAYLLVNVHGWHAMFWLSIMPFIIILAVGTKLQSIIAQMAIDIEERHAVVQGIPLVQVSDSYFWFRNPKLVLSLIHLTLFQNAFEITYFIWISYEFGPTSCFHDDLRLALLRVFLGVGVQFLCSYITLPLYALVTQMGSHMKKTIFDEQTSKAIMSWHAKVKKKGGSMRSRSGRLSGRFSDDFADCLHSRSIDASSFNKANKSVTNVPKETNNLQMVKVDIPKESTPQQSGNRDLLSEP